jgi:hypothetical protein
MILKEHQFFVKARGIELQILGPFEAFEPAYRSVNSSVHQQNCFVEMRFLHLNLLCACGGKPRLPVDRSV